MMSRMGNLIKPLTASGDFLTPGNAPFANKIGTWLKTRDINGVEADGARITFVGGEADVWQDATGNNNHYTAKSSAQRPSWGANSLNLNNRPVLYSFGNKFMERLAIAGNPAGYADPMPGEIYATFWNNGQGWRTLAGYRFNELNGYGLDRLYFQTSTGEGLDDTVVAVRTAASTQNIARIDRIQGAQMVDAQIRADSTTITRNASTTDTHTLVAANTELYMYRASVFGGYYDQNPSDFFIGEIFEYVEVPWNTPLAANERNALRAYMMWNAGLENLIPADNVFKLAAPTV